MGILAWHFTDGMKLRDGQPLVVGKKYEHVGPIRICESGLHASIRAIDALQYSPGSIVSRVECDDIDENHSDKFVCRSRRVIACSNASKAIIGWSAECALKALLIADVTDQRCFDAVEAVFEYCRTGVWTSEMDAAWDAARIAAWDAAWDTARAAAGDTARAAAWDAAGAAAGAAAWDAAGAAAWDAAGAAAWDAAWDAARAAAGDAARAAARDAAGAAAGDAARVAARDTAWDAAGAAAGAAARAAARIAAGAAARVAAWDAAWGAARDEMNIVLESRLCELLGVV